mmetsp:Transcript_37633/g.91591  ORF Transcript_37633/g.91591 Transcript_37633/m.91591 type:complete len:450 (+) Transcript_37633:13-1362(+)
MHSSAMPGVCVATVATASRLINLHRLAATWSGVLSVAYLTSDLEGDSARGIHVLATQLQALPANPNRFSLTLVEDVGYLSPLDRFPTNLLRNVATEGCPSGSDAILMIDVDFEICCGAEEAIERSLNQYADAVRRSERSLSFVLPAFEFSPSAPGDLTHIRDKNHLNTLIKGGLVNVFQEAVAPSSHACDRATDWLNIAPWGPAIPTEYTFACEPYTLYSRAKAPPYEELFVGYGKNRVSFHYEMKALGTTMQIIPGLFVYHQRYHQWPMQELKGAALLSPTSFSESRPGHHLHRSMPKRVQRPPPPPNIDVHRLDNATVAKTRLERNANFNWMVGETCWSTFTRRIRRQYNFSMTSEMQEWIDNFMRNNITINPSLRLRVKRENVGMGRVSETVEPVCAAANDNVCVKWCRPQTAVLQSNLHSFQRIARKDEREGKRQQMNSRLRSGN